MSLPSQLDEVPKIGRTFKGDPYIVNQAAITEIVSNVRSGHFCTVLGPPYSQKSLLLRDVKARLNEAGDEACVVVDLAEVDAPSDEDFLAAFAGKFAEIYTEATGFELSLLGPHPISERDLQNFLRDSLLPLRSDLILLLDHLERVRLGPVKALLRVLRALYIERDSQAPFRLVVVTANALNTAALALGPTSPFNIARVILIHDLSPVESETLIKHSLAERGSQITTKGLRTFTRLTGGDRDLIRKLSMHCLDEFSALRVPTLGEPHLAQTTEWFITQEARNHRPLQEITRAIEADPDTLMNILQILKEGQCLRRELRLDLVAEVDDLLLTGAVRALSTKQGPAYRIRNEVYERYLRQHFVPDRVVHVLSVTGQWQEAIPYLQVLVAADYRYRSTLLATLVNAIHAASQITEACRYVVDSLSYAFAVPQVRMYLATYDRSRLRRIYGSRIEGEAEPDIPLTERHRMEVRAFLGEEAPFLEDCTVARTPTEEPVLLIPLLDEEGKRLGVVAVHGLQADPRNENFQELLAFLGPVSRAIGSTMDREGKILQLDVLNKTGRQVTSSLDLRRVLQTVVEAAIEAVPAAQKGSLFLWDAARGKLTIAAQRGFRSDIDQVLQLDEGKGYASWVYHERKALRLDNVLADTRTKRLEHPDVLEEKSAICVPLEAWERNLGVLCLHNTTTYAAFRDDDVDVLATLGSQAAIAIENARLFEASRRREKLLTALDETSLRIRGDRERAKLLHEIVRLAVTLLGCQAGGLFLNYPHLGELELAHVYELPERLLGVHVPSQVGIVGGIARTGQKLAVSDYLHWPEREPVFDSEAFTSAAGVPIKQAGEVQAVLIVGTQVPGRAFTDDDLDVLERFAAQAAVALQTSALVRREDRRLGQLRVLHGISEYIQASDDLDKILRVILTGVTAGYSIGFNRAALFLFDEERRLLTGKMGIGHLKDGEARGDWDQHHRAKREDFGVFLEYLEADRLPMTPIGERVRGLAIPVGPESADVFAQVITSNSAQILDLNGVSRLPKEFAKCFEPAAPVALAPLTVGGRSIGLIVADNKFTRSPVTDEDLELLLTLANTAAVAIENKRLFHETKAARAALQAYFEASNALTSSDNINLVQQTIVDHARLAAGADGVSLILMDQGGRVQEAIVAGIDIPSDITELARPGGQSMEVMRTGLPQVIENTELQKTRVNPSLFWRQIKSAFCLPVALKDEHIGVMWFHYKEARSFTRAEIDAARLYVNQAALAYDSARRIQELEHLRQAAESLAGAEGVTEVLERVVESARKVLQADSAAVWSYDEVRTQFILEQSLASGIDSSVWQEFLKEAPGAGQTAYHVMDAGLVTVPDIRDTGARFSGDSTLKLLSQAAIRSFRGISLKVEEERLGVLYVNYAYPRTFSAREERILRTFGNHAALALQKNRLLEQVKRARNFAGLVAKVTALGDVSSTLQSVVEGTFEALRCDAVTLYRYDETKGDFDYPPVMRGAINESPAVALGDVQRGTLPLQILEKEETYYVQDAAHDPLFGKGRFVTDEHIRACAAVPLCFGDRKVGVMFVNYRDSHHFSLAEKEDIALFAAQAAVAIRNAQQFDELNRTKQLMAARSSVAWVGMVGSVWRHTTDKHAITIREAADLVQRELSSPKPDLRAVQQWLETIERLASQILEKPLTPPLTAEEGVRSVALNAFLRERKERMWASEPYKSCPVRMKLSLSENASVRASVEWLRRALEIVIDNAINAMADVSKPLLTIGSRRNGNFAEITVTDSGPGIPSAILERLFKQPIEKPIGSKGLGLGLVLAQMIVQTYGGQIRIGDTGPRGTTMVISLPLEAR